MSKYGAKKTEIDGIEFDSGKEADRYIELKLLERAGEISDLELQPKFDFKIEDKKIFTYIADFCYTENGKRIIEDVKGFKTPVFCLKKRLIEAQFGVKILIT